MIITRLWRQQPGKYFCISTKSESGHWRDHFFEKSEFAQVRNFLDRHRKYNLYFCPHGFSKPRRLKQYAIMPKLLWSDMDEIDPTTVKYQPTVAIESSPGRYVGLWVLDRIGSEELNRRMCYAIGADKSGWDLTQVLRVPGTINYKYVDRPRTRVMWGDHNDWSVSQLDDELPQEEVSGHEFDASDASKIYRKWERKLPHRTRRELMTRKEPAQGKRSEFFMRLAFELMEAGVPKDDGCTILKASVWNKYAGRRDEDKQISQSWDKAVNKKMKSARVAIGEDKDPSELVRADQLRWKQTHWLWYPRIPSNSITILGARGGTGKGLVCCDIVGRITTGEYWPCSKERIAPGNILWGEAEDKLQETVLPRLMASKTDQSKVFFCTPSQFKDYDIRDFIRANNIRLIVLSPLISFLEGVADSNAAVDTRKAMEDLDALIDDTGCAIVGVMHIKKGEASTSADRLLGSTEFANYARSILMLYREEDGVVRMIHPKYNLGPQGEDLIFKPINRRERTHPRGQFIGVDWDKPLDSVDVDTVFERKEKSTRKQETESASEWLQKFLKGKGEIDSQEVFAAGERASHSAVALKRAKLRAGALIRHRRIGPGRVVWALSTADVG